MGWVVDAKSLYRRERDPVPILQQCTGGSASLGTGTDGKEKSRPHRGRCPDSTANDTFLLSSKWHKEVFNDFCFYHVPFFFRYVQSYDGYSSHPFVTPIFKNITNLSTRLILTIRTKIISSRNIFIVRCIYSFLCTINTKYFCVPKTMQRRFFLRHSRNYPHFVQTKYSLS